MPRPIEFDREEALRRAMSVFWRQGYHATSVKDLSAATHLQPGSLYGTFRNKRSLFIAALDAYFSGIRERIQSCLHGDGAPLTRLRTFFDMLIEEMVGDSDNKGCLLVNTLLETPADDTEINRRVSDMFAEVEAEFARVLREAQSRGELDASRDPAALARLLVAGIYGLRVYHKTRPDAEKVHEIIDNLFYALGTPAKH
ncbi:TetR/AcrR family transcriptional regulator [Thiohalophilus thiocyanatoxydans]|uniref:TetR family transcriptional regulator n=1 Tax=Thiohalophilus thiocyanatoxydans TaxID=381308 RepID=A0A4R8IIR8_9GAMM|nr:TetR/AcrR family transcriptional regulator [Thiohalophilus thiocyanatoxydans]TDY00561.1 TetR family transcriptional regulator [Thiohalophilus thiocyanatoxydans]